MSPLQFLALGMMAIGALGPAGSPRTREQALRTAVQSLQILANLTLGRERLALERARLGLAQQEIDIARGRLELQREKFQFQKDLFFKFYESMIKAAEEDKEKLQNISIPETAKQPSPQLKKVEVETKEVRRSKAQQPQAKLPSAQAVRFPETVQIQTQTEPQQPQVTLEDLIKQTEAEYEALWKNFLQTPPPERPKDPSFTDRLKSFLERPLGFLFD